MYFRVPTAMLIALAVAGSCAAQEPASPALPLVDHHMHIFSPEAARVLKISCVKLGPVKCPPEISTMVSTGADAVRALDGAGIKAGVLLSTAYFFGSPEAKDLGLDVVDETRAENRYVVDQARAQCGRLAAFISVDPLAPNAISEIDYWGKTGGAVGLKLHLGNSNLDLRSPEQAHRLAMVFAAAARNRFPIVIHLETRSEDYGARDAEIFIRDVLPAARGESVQVAHAAGGGGVTPGTLSALRVFADAIEHDPRATSNVVFDLAMMPDLMSNSAKLPAKPEDVAALRSLMRRIGIQRFVLGSDWTEPLDLKRYYEAERAAFGLSDSEWRQLASNVAPYLRQPPTDRRACSVIAQRAAGGRARPTSGAAPIAPDAGGGA